MSYYCVACKKNLREVKYMIVLDNPGRTVMGATSICEECVDLCAEIIEDKRSGVLGRQRVKRFAELLAANKNNSESHS